MMLDDIHVQELPGLPFQPDVPSARAWLDHLPLGNTLECCRLLHEAIFGLRMLPLAPELRLALLETCRPAVYGTVYAMMGLCLGKPFPLEHATRKLALYGCRFHLETAATYRGIVRLTNFVALFDRDQRARVVARALEHLGHALLRISQIYELPPREIWSYANELLRYAEKESLLDDGGEPGATPRAMFQRLQWFALSVPGRMAQVAMQRLFDRLAAPMDNLTDVGFWFESVRPALIVPGWLDSAPLPGTYFMRAGAVATAVSDAVTVEEDTLDPALPRLGRALACPEDMEGLPTEIAFGFKPVAMTLRFLEARRFQAAGTDYWPRLHGLDFKPLAEIDRDEQGETNWFRLEKSILAPLPDKRIVDIVATELLDYCLADTGEWPLRAGLLVGIDLGDWIRLGTVRGGQPRGGRLWHSIEMLGTFPRLVNVQGKRREDGLPTGFLLDDRDNQGGVSLIVPPVRWGQGDPVRVDGFREKQFFRIGRLVELSADYCQFELLERAADSA